MQWVNTLIGLGKQTNLHLQSKGVHWCVGWVQMNPHAPPGDATELHCYSSSLVFAVSCCLRLQERNSVGSDTRLHSTGQIRVHIHALPFKAVGLSDIYATMQGTCISNDFSTSYNLSLRLSVCYCQCCRTFNFILLL